MHRVVRLRRAKRGQQVVSLDGVRPRRDEAQPQGDAMDVGIDREGGAAEREKQHDGRRLWPHAVDGRQPGQRLVERQVGQEVE